LLLKADYGSGKSKFLGFAAAALGPQAIEANNFSEAGLRQSLADEARMLCLDEAETGQGEKATAFGIEQVIRLIRQMSGGGGVKGVRGTADGIAHNFQLPGSAMLACINPPPTDAAGSV